MLFKHFILSNVTFQDRESHLFDFVKSSAFRHQKTLVSLKHDRVIDVVSFYSVKPVLMFFPVIQGHRVTRKGRGGEERTNLKCLLQFRCL